MKEVVEVEEVGNKLFLDLFFFSILKLTGHNCTLIISIDGVKICMDQSRETESCEFEKRSRCHQMPLLYRRTERKRGIFVSHTSCSRISL